MVGCAGGVGLGCVGEVAWGVGVRVRDKEKWWGGCGYVEVRFRVCRVRDRELRVSVCRGLGSGLGRSGRGRGVCRVRVCRGRVGVRVRDRKEWWRGAEVGLIC